ncbi:MAG: DUF402 domain-containing protein [Chloroflexota bacterium]|nr:MAG: DUF402 domain-containing protein [Chloroflexota bacterium]
MTGQFGERTPKIRPPSQTAVCRSPPERASVATLPRLRCDPEVARKTMRYDPGAAVVWRSVKDGVVDAANPCRVVRDDDALIALYVCPGTRCRRRKGRRGGPSGRQMLPDGWTGEYEDWAWHTHRALFLYRSGDAHSTGLFWREADRVFLYWYVNLEAQWRRSPVGFDTWDHALDLVVKPDLSSWRFKDQDEFDWLRDVGIITESEATAILSEAGHAIDADGSRDLIPARPSIRQILQFTGPIAKVS